MEMKTKMETEMEMLEQEMVAAIVKPSLKIYLKYQDLKMKTYF